MAIALALTSLALVVPEQAYAKTLEGKSVVIKGALDRDGVLTAEDTRVFSFTGGRSCVRFDYDFCNVDAKMSVESVEMDTGNGFTALDRIPFKTEWRFTNALNSDSYAFDEAEQDVYVFSDFRDQHVTFRVKYSVDGLVETSGSDAMISWYYLGHWNVAPGMFVVTLALPMPDGASSSSIRAEEFLGSVWGDGSIRRAQKSSSVLGNLWITAWFPTEWVSPEVASRGSVLDIYLFVSIAVCLVVVAIIVGVVIATLRARKRKPDDTAIPEDAERDDRIPCPELHPLVFKWIYSQGNQLPVNIMSAEVIRLIDRGAVVVARKEEQAWLERGPAFDSLEDQIDIMGADLLFSGMNTGGKVVLPYKSHGTNPRMQQKFGIMCFEVEKRARSEKCIVEFVTPRSTWLFAAASAVLSIAAFAITWSMALSMFAIIVATCIPWVPLAVYLIARPFLPSENKLLARYNEKGRRVRTEGDKLDVWLETCSADDLYHHARVGDLAQLLVYATLLPAVKNVSAHLKSMMDDLEKGVADSSISQTQVDAAHWFLGVRRSEHSFSHEFGESVSYIIRN